MVADLKIRAEARTAALAIRAAIADRSLAGKRSVAHLLVARPRRGVWLVTWSKLPGLMLDAGRRVYWHTLLPAWEYTVAEMKTEMLDDLDHFALTGEQPKTATTKGRKPCVTIYRGANSAAKRATGVHAASRSGRAS